MSKRNQRLATVGFVATILVVMGHAVAWCPPDSRSTFLRVIEVLTAGHVAYFFSLSGYFLALHYGQYGWWKQAIIKRCRTLMVPYFLWGGLLFIVSLGASCCAHGLRGQIFDVFQRPVFGLLDIFGCYPAVAPYSCAPLWYVKTLFYFVIVSPLFFAFLRKGRFNIILILVFIYSLKLSGDCLNFHPEINLIFYRRFSLVGFGAFLCGAACAFYPLNVKVLNSRFVLSLSLILYIGSSVLRMKFLGASISNFYSPFHILIVVVALHLFTLHCSWRVSDRLGGCTFFIYVTHCTILGFLGAPLACKLFDLKIFPQWAIYLIVLSVTLFICFANAFMVKKFFPRVYSVLTGGR